MHPTTTTKVTASKVADAFIAPPKAYKKQFAPVLIYNCDNCITKHDRFTNCLNNINCQLCPGTPVHKFLIKTYVAHLLNGRKKNQKDYFK